MNDPINLVDLVGLWGYEANRLNLFEPGSKHYVYASGLKWHNGEFGVYAHGDELGVYDDRSGTRIPLTPNELADLIKSQGWEEGTPVRLAACYTGRGNYPKELARILNADVYSADNYVHLNYFSKDHAVGYAPFAWPEGEWKKSTP
jgi:hypothetical protein